MKQERKFPLAEVHTKMGTMGEVRLNQAFLDVLGVKPGDFLVFTVSQEGSVTVASEKQTKTEGRRTVPDTTIPHVPRPDQVTQVTLFSTEEQSKAAPDDPNS
jgi:bifunctional DNA-binding transcriptional regulator/antitoxin component of YhaV-PrlF toxin-antitoxin module